MPLQHAIEIIQAEWPKALLSLVIPSAQAVWKSTQSRRVDYRRKTLRAKISELAEFMEHPLHDFPAAAAVQEATRKEYHDALAQLASLSSHEHKVAQREIPIGAFRRWFLLYTPRTPAAWLPQILYYLTLGFTILGAIGIFSSPGGSDFWSGVLGLAIFALFVWMFRAWAARTNRLAAEGKAETERVRRWIPITCIVIASMLEFFGLIGLALDKSGQYAATAFRENMDGVIFLTVMMGSIILACAYRLRKSRARIKFETMTASSPAAVSQGNAAKPESTEVNAKAFHQSA